MWAYPLMSHLEPRWEPPALLLDLNEGLSLDRGEGRGDVEELGAVVGVREGAEPEVKDPLADDETGKFLLDRLSVSLAQGLSI